MIEDALFEGNVGGGAGLYARGGAPVIRRATFRGNGGAGAVRYEGGSEGLVEDALFERNRGQAAVILASSPTFRRTTFRGAVAPFGVNDGGGALIREGAPVFEDCLFEDNDGGIGGTAGGAVYVDAVFEPARPLFVRTTFRRNTANIGGAVWVRGSPAVFLDCRFEGNRALGGGALYTFDAAVAVVGAVFVGNRALPGQAVGFGGAVALDGTEAIDGVPLIANAVFAGNVARRGGAISLAGTEVFRVDLVNVTVAGNEASETGGALRLLNAEGVRLQNAVSWGNAAPAGPEVYVTEGAAPEVEHAIVAGGCPAGSACSGVLGVDPAFVRPPSPGPDGAWGTADDDYGDLRLREGSPAVDHGLVALLPPDVWDLDGDGDTEEPLPIDVAGMPRVVGAGVDAGAYEGAVVVSNEPGPEAMGSASLRVYPNPVRGVAEVVLVLPEAGAAEVSVYDALGRRVAVLHAGRLGAGEHVLPLDVQGLPPGVYVVRAEAGQAMATARVTFVR